MAKEAKVTFRAVDAVTPALRGMKGNIETFSRSITKIAAGIGLADSFKAVGRFIKEAVGEAAAAYPKLGAGLDKVGAKFTEFKIQMGAAFLEVLQPVLPLIQNILGWATRLAVQLPDAFDGMKIAFVEIGGFFKKLPSQAAEAFGEIAKLGGDFIANAGQYLPMLGLNVAGASLRMKAWGVAVIANARTTIAGIEAEVDRSIAKYGGTHDYGQRALSAADQTAVDKARAEAERLLLARQVQGKPSVVDRRIPLREMRGGPVQTNEEAGLLGSEALGLTAFQEGLERVLGPLDEFNALSADTNALMGEMVGLVGVNMAEAMGTFFEALGAGKASLADFGKMVVGAVADAAIQIGKVTIGEGAVNIAKGLWGPLGPNPVQVAAGKKQVIAGTALVAIASTIKGAMGGSGSGAGAPGGVGGSGGLARDTASQSSRDLATRGKMVVNVKGAGAYERSPEYRDAITALLREAADLREIEFRYT